MSSWLRQKTQHIRHALQELRTGDAIGSDRSVVRVTIVGGRPPGDDVRIPVPMGIERVLRKAAVNEDFRHKLLEDRAAALEASGLALTPSERAILLGAPEDQLASMIEQIAPADPTRRSLLRRLAAAAGIALFGAGLAGSGSSCKRDEEEAMKEAITGIRPEQKVRPDEPPRIKGIMSDMPPAQPAGIRPGDPGD